MLGSSSEDDRDDVQALGADVTLIHNFTTTQRRLK